jgi:hypothetical protein
VVIVAGFIGASCGRQEEARLEATPTATTRSTPTPLATSGTLLNFDFKTLKVGFPGYNLHVRSSQLTAKLNCALEQGATEGEVTVLGEGTTPAPAEVVGVCDTRSAALEQQITGELTLTLFYGAHPVVNELTKPPDRLDGDLSVYSFHMNFFDQ